MGKIKKEIGYSCSRGSNHVDFYEVDECVCGSKANGRVYIEFDSYVTEAEADRIVEGFIEERLAHLESHNQQQDNYWK